jgi:hypothetical protein
MHYSEHSPEAGGVVRARGEADWEGIVLKNPAGTLLRIGSVLNLFSPRECETSSNTPAMGKLNAKPL